MVLERFRQRPRVASAWSFAGDVATAFTRDRVTGRASEVAFWWVFTLFPALLVLAAVLGFLGQLVGSSASQQVEDALVRVVADFTGSEANEAVAQVRALFDRHGAGLLTFGVLLALWSTSRSFTALIYSLDEVYAVSDSRGHVKIRAVGFGLALLTIVAAAVVALTMVVVGPFLGRGGDLTSDTGVSAEVLSTIWTWLRVPFAVLALVGFHTTIFWIAPDHRVAWRTSLPGGGCAAGAWVMASVGFSIYLDLAAGSSLVVGVLGGALSVMLWLYLLAIGLLLGGVVNAELGRRGAGRRPVDDQYPEARDCLPSPASRHHVRPRAHGRPRRVVSARAVRRARPRDDPRCHRGERAVHE